MEDTVWDESWIENTRAEAERRLGKECVTSLDLAVAAGFNAVCRAKPHLEKIRVAAAEVAIEKISELRGLAHVPGLVASQPQSLELSEAFIDATCPSNEWGGRTVYKAPPLKPRKPRGPSAKREEYKTAVRRIVKTNPHITKQDAIQGELKAIYGHGIDKGLLRTILDELRPVFKGPKRRRKTASDGG